MSVYFNCKLWSVKEERRGKAERKEKEERYCRRQITPITHSDEKEVSGAQRCGNQEAQLKTAKRARQGEREGMK